MAELPDLAGVYFDVLKEFLLAGDTFDVQYNIQNKTPFGAGFFDVEFYLSENPQISSSDFRLGEETFSALPGSGSTGILTKSLTLPNTANSFWERTGTYYLGYLVDAGGFVVEEDEKNNRNTGDSLDYHEINVITKADLFGVYFDVIQEPQVAGNSFDIEFIIENGLPLATGSFDVEFYLSNNKFISDSDHYLGSYTISSLGGNSKTDTLTGNFTLPGTGDSFWDGDGTYYIGMVVDGGINNNVLETNEGNNSNTGEFKDSDAVNIQTLADLSGKLFDVVVEPLKAGDAVDINFIIQNNSPVNAGAFEVRFYLSENNYISTFDIFLGNHQVSNLAGNSETEVISVSLSLPTISDSFWEADGSYHIGMIVDPLGAVAEGDENNNSNVEEFKDSDAVNIQTLADLSASLFNVIEEPLVTNSNFQVEYSIENKSLISVESFNVDFYLSKNEFISTQDKLLGTATINSIAGESSTNNRSINLKLPNTADSFWEGDGTYYLGIIVDSGKAIAETDENNNQNTGLWVDYEDVEITIAPDAEVKGISASLEDSLGFDPGITEF
ncbi:MAG: hypothetical protein DSM107014_16375 [Gomphosphaeria aponina SAG 52.96 = DSM 107014]|uniref:CARDB domain-containing protein n=1 Tax=Gomphosphaeria aponina SAG 52.96 = DSM 107014 TaxID=1521640 RepID=A0A941GXY0_9CHRO|nr:hypothetical protein [Gomphosphaeria aponina SAG 52.96 = DSM 107014]